MPLLTTQTISSMHEALMFMTECTLATIEGLAGLARPPKHELERQIAIAQTGSDWCARAGGIPEGMRGLPRLSDLLAAGISVQEWVNR